jgi:hypothetical protein
MKRYWLLFIFVVLRLTAGAQFVDYGEDPPLNWYEIKTDHYRVIYPKGNEPRARVYASVLESIYPHVRTTMSAKYQSLIPVVLHPYNITSNGMVAWAPKRMELLPSPGSDARFQFPELSLSLHESRHVAQMDKLKQGIYNPLYYILGQQIIALPAALVPQWFLEGEAVLAETALSSSGRGRMAAFMMPYRAQIATGKNFSLDKWFLGSYRDFTHDYYALGYGMTSYARLRCGADVWNRVLDKMTHTFPVYPFTRSLKKHVGLSQKRLLDSTFVYFQKEWDLLEPEKPDAPLILSPETRGYTSYLYPQEVEGAGIISLKKSLTDIPALVLIDPKGKEHHLTYVGNVNSKLSCAYGFVYWTEYLPGIRWEHENYSVVKQLNIRTKQVTIISKRYQSRYFSPTPLAGYPVNESPKGKIAVAEHTPEGQNRVVLMDLSGRITAEYPVLGNLTVQDMVADNSGNLFVSLVGRGSGIFKLGLNSSKWEGYLKYQRTNIEALRLHGDKLFFESGYSGVNNIYSFDTLSFAVKRLTNARFGAFAGTLSLDGKRLYFSDYSATGHKLASIETALLNEERVTFADPHKFATAEALSAQESYNIDEAEFKGLRIESKPYRKAAHLLNIHSWAPVFFDVDEVRRSGDFDFNRFKPGVTLFSQNSLNTLTSQLSYYYDVASNSNHAFLSFKYSGLFPVFQFKMDVGGQRSYFVRRNSSESYAIGNEKRVTAEVSAYVPLNFTKDYHIHGLQPYLTYRYTNYLINDVHNQKYSYIDGGIYYYRYRAPAHRDIFPKTGVQVWVNYVGNPSLYMGQLMIAKANVYLPGLLPNAGLRLRGSYQYQFFTSSVDAMLFFPELFADIARGSAYYSPVRDLYTIKGDYSFPILYPDLALGSVLYLSRIRGNLFYDYSNNQSMYASSLDNSATTVWDAQTSFGFDLIFDLNVFRIKYAPATLMYRVMKINNVDFLHNFSVGITL